jgi:hypothetical protein
MGKYNDNKFKTEGVLRPILPKNFVFFDGDLTWDDSDAVYNAGEIEASTDGETWEVKWSFIPDQEEIKGASDEESYRLRVKYNFKWSVYLDARVKKAGKTVEPEKVEKAEVIKAEPKKPVVVKKAEPKKITKKKK